MEIYKRLLKLRDEKRHALAVLIDPDKIKDFDQLKELLQTCAHHANFLFVGGSLLTADKLKVVVSFVKKHSKLPVILFPGSNLHIDEKADALLFLSLISGRNPDLLIGQHVAAAPLLKGKDLEVISTGYLLIDSGVPTTASYISNTFPIPHNKAEIAACTAMAGEMLGMKLTYLDGGSGAARPVSEIMIREVRKSVDTPIIVGGGIRSAQQASQAWAAGADVVVIGNGIEKDPNLLIEVSNVLNLASLNV